MTQSELKIKGNWNEIKGKVKQKWAQVTDDDLLYERGQEDQLLGRLQRRTGEVKDKLRDFINNL